MIGEALARSSEDEERQGVTVRGALILLPETAARNIAREMCFAAIVNCWLYCF